MASSVAAVAEDSVTTYRNFRRYNNKKNKNNNNIIITSIHKLSNNDSNNSNSHITNLVDVYMYIYIQLHDSVSTEWIAVGA